MEQLDRETTGNGGRHKNTSAARKELANLGFSMRTKPTNRTTKALGRLADQAKKGKRLDNESESLEPQFSANSSSPNTRILQPIHGVPAEAKKQEAGEAANEASHRAID